VVLWLEPWADEVTIPSGATAILRIVNATAQSNSLDVEETDERVVVWATSGDCVKVYVDDVLQHTGSASIPVPDGFGTSTKTLLRIMFGSQPAARLAGGHSINQAPCLWQRIRQWCGV
jgi:hypothetical protein